MNKSLQSYTPRARPLDYDSLRADTGCQETQGIQVFRFLPFTQICTFDSIEESDSIFNRPGNVSYADGPTTLGEQYPWPSRWAAWIASLGIRVGRFPAVVLPANTQGELSALFPALTSSVDKVTLGFTPGGFMALAIDQGSSIRVKWFKGFTATGDHSFVGKSPVLFGNSLVATDDPDASDLAIYYLRPSSPRMLFARFESEGFAIERVVNPNLQVKLDRLVALEVEDGKAVLYARDENNRTVTLRTAEYGILLDNDAGMLALSFSAGAYQTVTVEGSITTALNRAALTLSIEDGTYKTVVKSPAEGTLLGDAGLLTLSVFSGEYE